MLKAIAQRWQSHTGTAAALRGGATDAPDPRLDALRAGDAPAIEAVLHELLPRVRSWIHHRIGPDLALDDVTQEVLAELARAAT